MDPRKITLFAVFSLWVFFESTRADEPFPIALTTDFDVEELEHPAQIWLPENYDPSKKWPVIFYYHGTNGKPTIEFLRLVTRSKDWILIGMGYRQPGQFQYTEENLSSEMAVFQFVLDEIGKRVQIDSKKIYISGCSKGGWITGLFLQKIPNLAGGLIMCGGLIEAKEAKLDPADHIYIGVGESDGNIAMSFGARERFTKAKTNVVLDVWEGLGHELPNAATGEKTDKLSQWLRIEAGLATQDEAITWFDEEYKLLGKQENSDRVAAFHKLIELTDMPYRLLLDQEAEKMLQAKQKEFREDPELADEMSAWIEFQNAIIHESQDRFVSTLAEALGKYSEVAKKHPQTKFGRKAANSVSRIKSMLGME